MPDPTGFLGMRGSGDFTVTGQRPENWRQKIMELFPNGDAPLTAILSMMRSEKTDDPHYHWFTRRLSSQRVTGTAGAFIYKDSDLSTAYADSDDLAAGSTVFAKMDATDIKNWVVGMNCVLRDANDYTNDVHGEVTGVIVNGASSYVSIKLLQADGTGTGDLSDCDTLLVTGSSHAEGSESPDAVMYDPTENENYTQIFRSSLELTRTAMQTHLRTGDAYKDAKKMCLRMHSIAIEKAILFNGPKTLGTGSNGKPKRTTAGLIYTIKNDTDAVNDNYETSDTSYNGKTWVAADGGIHWLETQLADIFKYGGSERLVLCGTGALNGIMRLARTHGQINLEVSTKSFGLDIRTWVSPFGVLHFKTHPLFSFEPTNTNSMLVLSPENLVWRYVQDTMFKKDKSWRDGGHTSIDGMKEEYLTEAGLEWHHPETFAYLEGVGKDNPS